VTGIPTHAPSPEVLSRMKIQAIGGALVVVVCLTVIAWMILR
jgi:hypothetical protein